MSSDILDISKGGGCGCKIDPLKLKSILSGLRTESSSQFIVGLAEKDDAAVLELDNESCLIQTVDFFLPVVRNPFDFGMIAAANALSDVYAMGGKPIMVSSILGWPLEKYGVNLAQEVLRGAESICLKAGLPISGGHSIETSEPIFGLTVNGLADKRCLKKKSSGLAGDYLYLSKPLGLGLLANAHKHGALGETEYSSFINISTRLNNLGETLGRMNGVTSMTDVTGFGLLGHLTEMLGEHLGADLVLEQIPVIESARQFADKMMYPNITTGNYNYVKDRCDGLNGLEFLILCDPQTSGGLLFTSAEQIVLDGVELIGSINDSGRISIV